MSVDSSIAIANTNESCRILTIAATLDEAKAFIESIKSLATSRTASTPSSTTQLEPSSSSGTVQTQPLIIPWTIKNRYYSADVHFALHTVENITPNVFSGSSSPAVVFVWAENESYANNVAKISGLMQSREYEAEVTLAVRIPALPDVGSISNTGEPEEEGGDIDTTLMSYGFEYVDATRPVAVDESGKRLAVRSDEDEEDDVPALPRVLDALSTIMWPSMRSGSGSSEKSGSRGGNLLDRSMDEDLQREHDEIIQELLAAPTSSSSSLVQDTKIGENDGFGDIDETDSKELQELHEQMRELMKDNDLKKHRFAGSDPWVPVSSTSPLPSIITTNARSMSPTDMGSMTPFGSTGPSAAGRQVSIGFEDDFTGFVSNPTGSSGVATSTETKKGSKPVALDLVDAEVEEAVLTPTMRTSSSMNTGNGFLSPAKSASGHGLGDGLYRSLGSVSDFGGSEFEFGSEAYEELDDEEGSLPKEEEVKATAGRIFGVNNAGDGGFDLEQVVGALQEYKKEIGGVENEEERREMAARVALGFAYGLGIP